MSGGGEAARDAVEGFRSLSTAVVADVLRRMGYPLQVMDPSILPIRDNWKLCGRAFTHSNLPARPDDASLSYEAESKWRPGDVIVESYWGAWGVNFAHGAADRGCAGAVIDGPYRDIPHHQQRLPDFPVFCRRGLETRSANPGGSHRGFITRWMHAYNVPINCGGVRVEPGDIVLGDGDGVVLVPRGIEDVLLKFSISFNQAEDAVVDAKRSGVSPAEAQELVKTRWPKESGLLDWLTKRRG